MTVVKTVFWFIRFVLYLIVVEPLHQRAVRLRKKGMTEAHDALVRRVVHHWAQCLIRWAGGTVTVEGLEHMPKTPAVYVCNHRSYADIPVILGWLGDTPIPLLAKKQIGKLPLIRGWMEELHCVFLDRDDMREGIKNLKEAEDWVRAGYSMVVFPEGTRSKDGSLGEFKAGAFRIAQKNKVPVVPFCMKNTDKLMARDTFWIHAAHSKIKILPPIDTAAYSKEDWRHLPKLTEDMVRTGLETMED